MPAPDQAQARPTRWRALIVDDEPPARRTLRLLLERDADFDVAGECDHGAAAVEAIAASPPDLLLLDVQMPGLDGFGVISAIEPDVVPAIVFVTAFDQYALRAFEARALDYLLKPFSDERCVEVLARVKHQLRQRALADRGRHLADLARQHDVLARRLVVRDAGRVLVLPWDQIDWIAAEDYCIRIHAGAEHPIVRRTLQWAIEALDAREFVRVHRSAVVNIARVRELAPLASGDGQVRLADGTQLRVSRGYRAGLETLLKR